MICQPLNEPPWESMKKGYLALLITDWRGTHWLACTKTWLYVLRREGTTHGAQIHAVMRAKGVRTVWGNSTWDILFDISEEDLIEYGIKETRDKELARLEKMKRKRRPKK